MRTGRRVAWYSGPRPRLHDVVPLYKAWHCLKSLELWFVYTTVEDLIALLRIYAASLRELHLAGVALCKEIHKSPDSSDGEPSDQEWLKASWRRGVGELAAFEELRHVSLRQMTKNTARDERGWEVAGPKGVLVVETDLVGYLADGEDMERIYGEHREEW